MVLLGNDWGVDVKPVYITFTSNKEVTVKSYPVVKSLNL